MMSYEYELALELKNAGFPQTDITSALYYNAECHVEEVSGELPEGCIKIPTLSELIEACGEEFHGLFQARDGNTGKGIGFWLSVGSSLLEHKGKTPEEAVAKLWLALNKQPTCG